MENSLKFKAIITGPEAYLPDGVKYEDFEITEEEIIEASEGESREDTIAYIKEEYCAGWEQHWCKVSLIPIEQFNSTVHV